MADRTLTVNGQPFTFNRDRFAGVRTMTVTGQPLTDSTTSIQVTVAGHSDLDGVYTTSGVGTAAIWLQQGGNGRIESGGYNSEGDYTDWYFRDVADSDPSVTYYGTQSDDRPWKPANTGIVTITPVPETVTVDRTAPVITSDRKGESRPLLSKVVGGAAAAYSLRDLNDRAGNNKVVEVFRSSDDTSRDFLAKEVSNGTLEAWVNEDYAKYTSDFSSGDDSWGAFDDVTETGNIDGIGGLDDNLRLAIGSATSNHRAFRSNVLPVNQKFNFSARIFIPSTNSVVDSIIIRDASNNVIVASTTPTQDQWVTVTANNVTLTNAQLRVNLQDGGANTFAGNGSDVIYLREITVTQVTSDGFVSKWYDQSGNERHAEQGASTNQPKIVDSGVLTKDTDGNPYLQFDGSQYFRIYKNNSLSEGLILPDIQNSFSVCVFSHTTSSSKLIAQLNRSGDRYYIYNRKVIIGNNITILDSASQNTKHVRSLNASASGVFNSYVDSVLIGTNTDTNTASGGDSSIGASATGATGLVGNIYELVVYRTDQSANRLAIEANINNQYDI